MNFYNENSRFISILSDYGFKVTFGNETDTRFLRRALQTLIKSPVAIREIQFIQNEIQALTKDSWGGVYDIMCTDETGNQFIVEMQLGEYPEFIQRMKFYSLQRINTLIRKGKYQFDDLPRIYCIGILAVTIFPGIADYHNIAVLRNESGELIDDQATFITVELDKFGKELREIYSDLDKLIYTMKTLHQATESTQYPQFWTEEWLQVAIKELDTRAMTPEERLAYEMTISANALAIKHEKRKISAAEEAAVLKSKTETIKNLLTMGLTVEQVAQSVNLPVEFAEQIRKEMSAN